MGSITTRSFYSAAVLFSVLLLYVQTSLGNDAGDQEARQAEIHLDQAIAEKDWAEVSKLLDGNFEWTDEHGQTQTRKQVLVDLLHFATNNSASSDIQTYFYGDLDLLFGFRGSIRFSHIWIKHAAGWKAFVFIDTPRPATSIPAATVPVQGDCENPCRTVPYTPTTTTDKIVLAEWRKTKIDEWQPNVADWEAHSADEVLIITNKGERNKSERLAIAKKNQQENIGVPGDPVLRMKMSDFENTVVMISDHAPYRGGKPYHNIRLFVNRDGRWMIAWSQQTTMALAQMPHPWRASGNCGLGMLVRVGSFASKRGHVEAFWPIGRKLVPSSVNESQATSPQYPCQCRPHPGQVSRGTRWG